MITKLRYNNNAYLFIILCIYIIILAKLILVQYFNLCESATLKKKFNFVSTNGKKNPLLYYSTNIPKLCNQLHIRVGPYIILFSHSTYFYFN